MKKVGCVLVYLLIGFIPLKGQAQIIPDQSLPVNSRVTINDNTFVIDQGTAVGNNLFHSFEEFSVPSGTTAWFNNASSISNIFSRITGQSPSYINGLIRSNPAANLFLINPNGIIFGSNASLNVGASFIATTANQVYFADGTVFDTRSPQPLLTISVPIGLGFGSNPASIINQSQEQVVNSSNIAQSVGLQVPTARSLTLVGGEIRLDGGYLSAPSGRIELGSVDANSQVSLMPIAEGYKLGYEGVSGFLDINLTNLAKVDASGIAGGAIHLQGRNIVLSEGAKVVSQTLGDISGQPVSITASDTIQVLGTTSQTGIFEPVEAQDQIFVPLRSAISSNTFGNGNAGDLIFNTRQLIIKDGAQITANAFSPSREISHFGNGGQIVVNASESIEVTGVVSVQGRGQSPFSSERVFFEVNGSSAIGTVTATFGQGGNITVNTNQLNLRNGGVITSSTFGAGNGGNLIINAAAIELQGKSPSGIVPSLLSSSSITLGDAGNIYINSNQLTLSQGARIETSGLNIANAGDLFVRTNNLSLNQGILSASTGGGEGGNISISAQDTLLMRNNSLISAQARGTGNGGNININTKFIVAVPQENNDIIANAVQGRGGNIFISTQGIFGLEPRDRSTSLGEITAFSQLGINGVIEITQAENNPDPKISQLPTQIETPIFLAGCQVRNGEATGRFVNLGRGGLINNPTEPLSNQKIWEDINGFSQTNSTNNPVPNSPSSNHSLEAKGWIVDSQGKIILVSSFPSVSNDTKCGKP